MNPRGTYSEGVIGGRVYIDGRPQRRRTGQDHVGHQLVLDLMVAGWSTDDIAKRIGASQGQVSRWARDARFGMTLTWEALRELRRIIQRGEWDRSESPALARWNATARTKTIRLAQVRGGRHPSRWQQVEYRDIPEPGADYVPGTRGLGVGV
jgi:transcriptional regulator with XRE-family HTH domain